MFIFDEELGLLFDRAKPLGFDLAAHARRRQAHHHAARRRRTVARRIRRTTSATASRSRQSSTVVIDSLNGYQAAMPEENSLILHMHELLQFLNRQGVSTFLTVAQHGLVGDMKSPVDVTYLADTVILLRFFEARGSVQARDLGGQEAHRPAREDDPRVLDRRTACTSASRWSTSRACCAACR